ncbi:hypothetical protein LUZ60_009688 [Juncus effusus]|nr:hypothetical protein LUZ60_009688 [Juncus effusus]
MQLLRPIHMLTTTASAASSPATALLLIRHRLRPPFITCSLFRRRRRPPDPSPRLTKPYNRRENPQIERFIESASEAFEDLSTAVRVDQYTGRVSFSCRQSSLVFVGNALLCGFLAGLALRFVIQLGLGFIRGFGRTERVITRRDRSLGGKEVVVGTEGISSSSSRVDFSPVRKERLNSVRKEINGVRGKRELPDWWPVSSDSNPVVEDELAEQYRKEAQKLVRVITDYRITGQDYGFDDIIRLRKLCKVSGSKVQFDTENSRDSLYRAAINFVLDICSKAIRATEGMHVIDRVEINGEEVREFAKGLAENVGLDQFRATTLVRGAVAARTRSCLLQCWALEIQNKRSEALDELLKICLIHKIFPPEENSPEMEMVANGLKKNLQMNDRERLLSLYKNICPADNHRGAAEALGFIA